METKKTETLDGIYLINYTGITGNGSIIFVLKDDVVAGSDMLGSILDGTCRKVGNDKIEFSATLKLPPGIQLVTGFVTGNEGLVQQINSDLPVNFSDGNPICIPTPTGNVNAVFKKLRNLP